MNCCNDFGNCTQGRDCPIRKQCEQEVYKKFYEMNVEVADPYDDVADTFKALIAFICVTAALTLFTFWYWGK
jgi:hypothetical protein